ncbi:MULTISPECIES: hypothetical protein [Paenibacillus]|uniref:hypothetical protein n=1 Tax=Paenibacillus TaxID=44249 RepID=UPI0022B8F1E2|nr:hypothetical protein [Paenibacillus caseinilyticus]MCZ8520143.1 hypothetical protein [Paenibacillus caseinilyticus]
MEQKADMIDSIQTEMREHGYAVSRGALELVLQAREDYEARNRPPTLHDLMDSHLYAQ